MNKTSAVRERRRTEVLEPICDLLLAEGLDNTNLRALAKVAGTSDRMLLYYFADKDDLIAEALDRLAERLASALDARMLNAPLSPDELTEDVWSAVCEPEVWPYILLFIELVVRAARAGEPYASKANAVSETFRNWLTGRLITKGEDAPDEEADRILATIDGRALLRLAGVTE